MEILALRMPNENYEQMFHAYIGWARFGELLAYDEEKGCYRRAIGRKAT